MFNAIDFESLGVVIVAIFAVSWFVSLAIYKYKRLENAEELPIF